jgi:hypothetical protein
MSLFSLILHFYLSDSQKNFLFYLGFFFCCLLRQTNDRKTKKANQKQLMNKGIQWTKQVSEQTGCHAGMFILRTDGTLDVFGSKPQMTAAMVQPSLFVGVLQFKASHL